MQRFSAILLLLVSAAAHSQELHVPEKVMKLDDGVYRLEKFVYGGSFEQRSGDLPGPGCRIVAKDNVIKYYYNETEEGGSEEDGCRRLILSAYAEDHGLRPWMNARRITLRSLVRRRVCFGGFRRRTWRYHGLCPWGSIGSVWEKHCS